MRKKLFLAPFGDLLPTRLRPTRPWKSLEIGGAEKTKATPQLTHPRWCDHLPRASPGEDCRVSLGGISLQHWRPSHDPGPQPKPRQHRSLYTRLPYSSIGCCWAIIYLSSSDSWWILSLAPVYNVPNGWKKYLKCLLHIWEAEQLLFHTDKQQYKANTTIQDVTASDFADTASDSDKGTSLSLSFTLFSGSPSVWSCTYRHPRLLVSLQITLGWQATVLPHRGTSEIHLYITMTQKVSCSDSKNETFVIDSTFKISSDCHSAFGQGSIKTFPIQNHL